MQQGRPPSEDDGQAVVIAALFMPVLLLFLVLVIDGGTLLAQKRDMQGAADAGALAGIRRMPDGQGAARLVATDYVENQNSDGGTATVTFDADATADYLTVEASVEPRTNFANMWSGAPDEITARSTTAFSQANGLARAMPLAFEQGSYTLNAVETILTDNNSPAAPGNRGIVSLRDQPDCTVTSGGQAVREFISLTEEACASEVNTTINAQPGQVAGPVGDGLDTRLGADNDAFTDVFAPDTVNPGMFRIIKPESPRIGVIPVIDDWPNGSSAPMTIVDYVVVFIVGCPPAGPCLSVEVIPVQVSDISGVSALRSDATWRRYDPATDAPLSFTLVN